MLGFQLELRRLIPIRFADRPTRRHHVRVVTCEIVLTVVAETAILRRLDLPGSSGN